MNDYIFDWAENSEKILNGEGYTTKVHQTFEQIMLFCYLREKGYNKEQIFDLWVKTNSLLLQKIGDDKDQRDKYFGKLLSDSTKYKIEKGNEIKIYQSEIDFINKMEVSMWIKQYVLTMLCIYKWYGKEWCVYNDKIKRFCYSCTDAKREKDKYIKGLFLAFKENKFYSIRHLNEHAVFKMDIPCRVDTYQISIGNPRNITNIFYMLNNKRKCLKCGEEFVYNYKTLHSHLCKKCKRFIHNRKLKSQDGAKTYFNENE